jgi:hypothetical protein
MKTRLFQVRHEAGDPVQVGEYQVVPISQALIIRPPFLPGGLIWNRPSSVTVSRIGEAEQTLPIRDVTREALWSLLAITVLSAVLAALVNISKKSGGES